MKLSRVIFITAVAVPVIALSAEGPLTSEAPPGEKSSSAPAPRTVAVAPRQADRLDLETSVVTGNRELPKVLYIVPWKKAELGDLPKQPFNTLLDEALAPLDRDEFRREVKFHEALSKRQMSGPADPVSTPAESIR